jgi:hypothetical protein
MKLGIMQPYFFPYFGHFALVAAVDEWVVFDVTQYTPKTWMNRNRILHPKESWQYVTVPLSNSSIATRIHEARVLDLAQTKTSLLGKLSSFRKQAPYFGQIEQMLRETFERVDSDSLCKLNVEGLKAVCRYLDLPFSYRICSELDLDYPPEMGAGDWAPFICDKLGASEYVNPAGGRALFDPAHFQRLGITLSFIDAQAFSYDCSPYRHEPNLSIIDVLLWNAPEKVAQALRDQARSIGT